MLKTINDLGRFFVVTNLLLVAGAGSTLAQSLPPAPKVDQSQEPTPQEYKFQAPTTPNPSSPNQSKAGSTGDRLYRVQIDNTSYVSLFIVRGVEPDAFIPDNRDIIQAGLFSNPSNAQELVQSLSLQGINAEIVPVSQ